MKLKYIKIITIFILVLSILIFVQNCFMFFIAGFVRKHDAVFIDENNRKNIITILKENIENFEEIPDIQKAVKIEYLALVHKDEVTIHYEDETTFIFYIKDAYKNPLTTYIKDNGYNIYFKSSEFIVDLIRIIVPLGLSVVLIVVLLKLNKRLNSHN